MDVLALRRQGLTLVEIELAAGYHPATISKWLGREGLRSGVVSRRRR
jgi:CYTH domain-containing protein